MKIEFDVKLTANDMFDFLMYHTYAAFSGIFSIFIGLGAIALSIFTWGKITVNYSLIYFVFGLVFLFYTPLTLKMRSKKQVKKSKVFDKPITYIMTDEKITSVQDDASEEMKWDQIIKVRSTKRSIIIYVTRIRAVIIPKAAISDQYNEVVSMIKDNVNEMRVKIK